jgi:uncharacterized membrane protein
MTWYFLLKLTHILSAAVLFGTGTGIAFFMLMAWRQGHAAHFAITARHVVLADFLFTTTAVIVQPITGIALILLSGRDPFSGWLLGSYGLYVLIGACWLPVVWIQIKVRQYTGEVASGNLDNQHRINPLMRRWFALGFPAFAGVMAIYLLMIVQP